MPPDWFDLVPKTETHLHLEGTIPLQAPWQLVREYGGDPAVPMIEALEEKFRLRDFPQFLSTWVWKSRFLKVLTHPECPKGLPAIG